MRAARTPGRLAERNTKMTYRNTSGGTFCAQTRSAANTRRYRDVMMAKTSAWETLGLETRWIVFFVVHGLICNRYFDCIFGLPDTAKHHELS
jgi:hypothetical protein